MGILKDKRSRAHADLERKQRILARKLDARPQVWRRLRAAEDRIKHREKERSEAHADGRPERVEELTRLIKDDRREAQNLREQLKALTSKIQRVKDAIGGLKDRIRSLTKRIQAQPKGIDESPGSPHWGGSADVFNRKVVPVAGQPHSTKRTETFGNPGSDHHVSQTIAYAGDFAPSITRAIAIGKAMNVPYYGYAQDYYLFYTVEDGHTYRTQIIAQNHGTGPHVHCGIERQN